MNAEHVEKHPVWQGIMDKAYEKMRQPENDYDSVLEALDERERFAIVLGNLNYQVGNGGFQQWVDNGYGTRIVEAVEALEKMGTVNALKVKEMLDQLEEYVKTDVENRGFCGNYWIMNEPETSTERVDCCECKGEGEVDCDCGDDDGADDECPRCEGSGYVDCDECDGRGWTEEEVEEEEHCDGWDVAHDLDDQYYEVNGQLMDEVEAFLSGAPLEKAPVKTEEPKESGMKPTDGNVRYPKVRVKLVGHDGNAFAIMGRVRDALKHAKVSHEEVEIFMKEATSGNYDHLLMTCMKWVSVS